MNWKNTFQAVKESTIDPYFHLYPVHYAAGRKSQNHHYYRPISTAEVVSMGATNENFPFVAKSFSVTFDAAIHICQPNWALCDGEFFAGIYNDFVAFALTERNFFERWFGFGSFCLHIGPNPRRNEPNKDSNN